MADYNNKYAGKKPGGYGGAPKNNTNYRVEKVVLPENYVKDLMDGYFVDGVVKKKMLIEYPKTLADAFAKGKPVLTNKQVRSFYEVVVKTDTQLTTGQKNVEQAKESLYGLIPNVHNKVKKELVPDAFEKFLTLNIDGITTAEDIKAFRKHFEAFVCYLPIEK